MNAPALLLTVMTIDAQEFLQIAIDKSMVMVISCKIRLCAARGIVSAMGHRKISNDHKFTPIIDSIKTNCIQNIAYNNAEAEEFSNQTYMSRAP